MICPWWEVYGMIYAKNRFQHHISVAAGFRNGIAIREKRNTTTLNSIRIIILMSIHYQGWWPLYWIGYMFQECTPLSHSLATEVWKERQAIRNSPKQLGWYQRVLSHCNNRRKRALIYLPLTCKLCLSLVFWRKIIVARRKSTMLAYIRATTCVCVGGNSRNMRQLWSGSVIMHPVTPQ